MRPFDANGAFLPQANMDGLRRRAVRGAGLTVLSGGVTLGVQMIATVVLARLVSPADFGLVTMVTTFSMLLINFGLNGFTEAVLQRPEISHELISTLFWINAGAGLLLTVAFAASGPLLARFYDNPLVTPVAAAMSITILLTTLSVQHLALLKRAMRFSVVSANEVIARAISVVVSIALALAGWGFWALVAGAIAQSVSLTAGSWLACRWIPGTPSRVDGTAAMVRFALSTYGRFIANYCTWNLDKLLIGWRYGATPLGFYKRAYDLFALSAGQLVAPLTSVAVSALSRLEATSLEYRRYLLGALGVTSFVGMGVGAALTLVGKDVILVLLGPNWGEAGRIFAYFGPGIGVMLIYYTHGWIHLSIGRADRWLRWGLIEFFVTTVLLLAGLPFGPVGIAVAWTVSFWVLAVPAFGYAGRPIGLGSRHVISATWRYVVASLLAGGATAAILKQLASFGELPGMMMPVTRIMITSALFLILYLCAVVLLHGGPAPLQQVARLIRDILPARKPTVLAEAADQTVG